MKKVLLLFAALVCIILSSCASPKQNPNARFVKDVRELTPTDTCFVWSSVFHWYYDCKTCLSFALQYNQILNEIDSVKANMNKSNVAQAIDFTRNLTFNFNLKWDWKKHCHRCHFDPKEHNQYYFLQDHYDMRESTAQLILDYKIVEIKEK